MTTTIRLPILQSFLVVFLFLLSHSQTQPPFSTFSLTCIQTLTCSQQQIKSHRSSPWWIYRTSRKNQRNVRSENGERCYFRMKLWLYSSIASCSKILSSSFLVNSIASSPSCRSHHITSPHITQYEADGASEKVSNINSPNLCSSGNQQHCNGYVLILRCNCQCRITLIRTNK